MIPNKHDYLLQIHGTGLCHICHKPRIDKGGEFCSYPHGMYPIKSMVTFPPDINFMEWKHDPNIHSK